MLNSIKLIGEYLGNDVRGIIVGGKHFTKNLVQETEVNEDTFKNLLAAQENGWFSIKSNNYNDYLSERGIQPVVVKEVETKVVEVTEEPVIEETKVVEEVKHEVKAKKKGNKTADKTVTEEVKSEETPSKEE